LNDDDIYLLITPFIPAPLIKIVEENGFTVFTEKQSDTSIYNYIKKK